MRRLHSATKRAGALAFLLAFASMGVAPVPASAAPFWTHWHFSHKAPPKAKKAVAKYIGHTWVEVKDKFGHVIKRIDAGKGAVTNIGGLCLVEDFENINACLKNMKYVGFGTGSTAPAATDYQIQTPIGTSACTGTQTDQTVDTSTTTSDILQVACTQSFTATATVAEITIGNYGTFSTSKTASATTANSLTDNAGGFTTNAYAGLTLVEGSCHAYVLSNTASVFTLVQPTAASTAWWTSTGTACTTPTAGSYTIQPTILDHKAINVGVGNGDSIAVTYKLTAQTGG